MKYLIINSVCKTSSTGSIAYGLHSYLKELGHTSIVCYGRGEISDDEDLIRLDSDLEVKLHAGLTRLTGLQGYFSNLATTKLLHILEMYRPDGVILLNLHGYYLNEYRLLDFLKKSKIRTVYIMPDEYPFLGKCCFSKDCQKFKNECGNCDYIHEYPKSLFLDQSKRIFRMKKKVYTSFNNLIFASPQFNILKAKESALLKDKELSAVDWGIDLENTYRVHDIGVVRKKYNIPENKKVILVVGSFLNERKGIRKFVFECAKQTKCDDLLFINVGFDGDENICPANFMPISYVNDQIALSEIYSCADLFVIASTADTMPLACLISLGCGTPICCFNMLGFPLIADATCATFIEPENFDMLLDAIERTPYKNKEIIDRCRSYAMGRYLDKDFYKRLFDLANENMGDENEK